MSRMEPKSWQLGNYMGGKNEPKPWRLAQNHTSADRPSTIQKNHTEVEKLTQFKERLEAQNDTVKTELEIFERDEIVAKAEMLMNS